MNPRDKHNRPLMEFDVVRVCHFTGTKRKKYYMYKQVIGIEERDGSHWMRLSHLDKDSTDYVIRADGRMLHDYEIVQGFVGGDFEERV